MSLRTSFLVFGLLLSTSFAALFLFSVNSEGKSDTQRFPASTANALDPAALGSVKLDGGTEKVIFDSGSVPYNEDPTIQGTCKNFTGAIITDMTVRIKRVGDTGHAPTGQTITIAGHSENFSIGDYVHVSGLSIAKGAEDVVISLKLNAPQNPASEEFKLNFTPSNAKRAQCADQDAIGTYLFSPGQPSITRVISDPGNPGATGVVLNNEDDSDQNMTALDGSVEFSASDPTVLTYVYLMVKDGESYSDVSGASISIDGNYSFSISNLESEPGEEYHIILLFDGTPSTVELALNSEWSDD